MKNYEYYVIMAENDTTEGRGGLRETGFCFERLADSLTFTKSKEMQEFTVMGYVKSEGHSELIRKKNINVFENINECVIQMKENLKKQALSKLTTEEKRILGLI